RSGRTPRTAGPTPGPQAHREGRWGEPWATRGTGQPRRQPPLAGTGSPGESPRAGPRLPVACPPRAPPRLHLAPSPGRWSWMLAGGAPRSRGRPPRGGGAPRCPTASASGWTPVPAHRGARVALRVDGVAAELAPGPAGGGHGGPLPREREHLLSRGPHPDAVGLGEVRQHALGLHPPLVALLVLVIGGHILELQPHAVALLLVADGQPAHSPHGLERFLELELLLRGAFPGLLSHPRQDVEDGGRQQLHLLLLQDQGDELGARSGLEGEGAVTRLPHGARSRAVDTLEVHPSILAPSPAP